MGKISDGRDTNQDEDFYSIIPSYMLPVAFTQNSTTCYDVPRPACSANLGWDPHKCKCIISPGMPDIKPTNDQVYAIQNFPNLPDEAFLDERMGNYAASLLKTILTDGDPTPFFMVVGKFNTRMLHGN